MGFYNDYLQHHGIKGQKWGVRRFEKAGGGLTAAGKARYQTDANGEYKKLGKSGGASSIVSTQKNPKVESFVKKNGINGNLETKNPKGAISLKSKKQGGSKADRVINNESNGKAKVKSDLVKKLAIAGGVTVAAGLTAYGLHKLNQKAIGGLRQEYKEQARTFDKRASNVFEKSKLSRESANALLDYSKKNNSVLNVNDYVSFNKIADQYHDIGKQYTQRAHEAIDKAGQKNYSLKEKVNYLRGKR